MAGTGSTSSLLTSSSHTLTHAPTMSAAAVCAANGGAAAVFIDSLYPTNRHVFLQPPPVLPAGSLQVAKEALDVLAGPVSEQQQQRLREAAGKKRKRDGQEKTEVLKIRKLHVDGFETGQVWQQAKKIIDSVLGESERLLQELQDSGEVEKEGNEKDKKVVVEFGKDGFEVDSDDDQEAGSATSQSDSEADSEDSDGEGVALDDEDDSEMLDGELSGEEEGEEQDEEDDEDVDDGPEEGFVEDPHGLNDGFFSIDVFNKQTQWFEAQDARADPNTDLASDDESVDWHGDPFAAPKKSSKKGAKVKKDEEDEEDEEDESDVDMGDENESDDEGPAVEPSLDGLNGSDEEPDGEDGADGDDLGLDLTANDIFYKDFFAPPARKKKPGSARKLYRPPQPSRPDDADMERAENDVRRDLFEDMSEHSDSEDALSDVSAGNPKSRRSAHERRQAKVSEEIRKLEAELVAKRAWTLAGEAKAIDRPVNSLLEEDLEFEHVGKMVPVITEAVSESIEDLIKRRILANEFDEVLRRRPDAFGNPNNTRRGLVDVESTKAKQSLAEIYEEEHVKAADPDAYVSQADEKLSRDEQEIKNMWKDVCAKLDALSSWHYKPKPAAPMLSVVADVATVTMEDAMPTTAQGVAGGASRMAPQEVYAPGKATAEEGEVVAKSGLPVARQEMTREEKLRRRRREKERIRKAGGLDAGKAGSKKAQERAETMNGLKKGGVKVINRKGEVVGLDGKKPVERSGPQTSGALKL